MTSKLWILRSVTLAGERRDRLKGITAQIDSGITAVIGYSGAGKTSLLNLLAQFEQPSAGEIRREIDSASNRLPIYWVPQNEGLWGHKTVLEHLEIVAPRRSDIRADFEKLLQEFDLTDHANELPGKMSQGERSRLAVARALASEATVLVMDEPLVHVDPARIGAYWQTIRDRCASTGTSVVFASHAPETVLMNADSAICLKEGQLLFQGPVDELYWHPPTRELAAFLGPANWFTPQEARQWLGQMSKDDLCLRPEQLVVRQSPDSPLELKSSRFAGSYNELQITHNTDGSRRTVFQRSGNGKLESGMRIAIGTMLGLFLCFTLTGCSGESTDPALDVKDVRSWSIPPDGAVMPGPRGMTVGPSDELYVLDDAGRVLVYDAEGEKLREWWMPDYDVGKPEGVCVFQDGRIAVADTHYHRVVFFDDEGQVVELFGSEGSEPGQFKWPVDVVQDDSGDFYVCEYGGDHRVQRFRVDGEFVLEFGGFGTAPGEFQRPMGLVWHEGRLYVADAINNRIQVFSDTGQFEGIIGGTETTGDLFYPYDITQGPKGNLYVIEYGANRVSGFSLDGELLGRYGEFGSGPGQFSNPWGLTINSKSRILVGDTGNRRIVELAL